MPQSKTASAVEQICNTFSGLLVALATWTYIVAPLYGIHRRFTENLGITGIFTVVSLCRGFIWRRAFNYIERRKDNVS